jgi:hypothetical protein
MDPMKDLPVFEQAFRQQPKIEPEVSPTEPIVKAVVEVEAVDIDPDTSDGTLSDERFPLV